MGIIDVQNHFDRHRIRNKFISRTTLTLIALLHKDFWTVLVEMESLMFFMIQVKCTISDVELSRLKCATTAQPNCRYVPQSYYHSWGLVHGTFLFLEKLITLIDAQVKFYFCWTLLSPKTTENSGKDLFHGAAN